MAHTSKRLVAVLAIGALALAGAGCGDDDDTAETEGQGQSEAAEGVFVGTVEGTDAYIALISDGTELRGGYLCDGEEVSVWFASAELSEGTAALASRAGDALGTATLGDGEATGEVTVAGVTHTFSARPATGEAGLYREATGEFDQPGFEETGWIVLADGSVRGRTNYIDPNNLKTGTKSAPASVGGDSLDTGYINPTSDV